MTGWPLLFALKTWLSPILVISDLVICERESRCWGVEDHFTSELRVCLPTLEWAEQG